MRFALLLAVLPLCSCMNISGEGWKAMALGTDFENIDLSAKGLKSKTINNSASLGKATQAVTDITKIVGTNKLIQSGIDATQNLGTQTINAIK